MANGIQQLYALNCIADNCELTDPLGRQMVEFPLDPMIGKMLLCSGVFNCSEEALTIAAMLQIESIFYNPSYKKKEAQRARLKFAALEGDHLTMLNVFNTFIKKHRHTGWCKSHFLNHKALCQAEKIRYNLKALLGKYKIPIVSCGR
uniref:Putative ATP-dependent RNA helicase DHX35 (Trinotate prediction) n=1 Tax=Myxobolus squamalis TaxID=59785 RepID=A0A6B2G7A9_MYXSQ